MLQNATDRGVQLVKVWDRVSLVRLRIVCTHSICMLPPVTWGPAASHRCAVVTECVLLAGIPEFHLVLLLWEMLSCSFIVTEIYLHV